MRVFFLSMISVISLLSAFDESGMKVISEFSYAKKITETYQKPLLIVFLGSSFGNESEHLLAKLKDREFGKTVGGQIGLYLADLNLPLFSVDELKNYQDLIEKFSITTFPTAVLCNKDLQEITRFGFCDWSSKELAQKISESNFTHDLISAKLQNPNPESLLSWYKKAAALGCQFLQKKIIELAFCYEKIDAELKIEKYLMMIREKEDIESLSVFRQKYLVNDFSQHLEVLDRVSLIDFQFHIPMLPVEKKHLEAANLEMHLVQVPN